MPVDKISIYKANQRYIYNEDIKRKVTAEINTMIPKLVAEYSEEEINLPPQIRISTSKLPNSVKRNVVVRKKKEIDKNYPDILLDIITESYIGNEQNLTKELRNIVENESAKQLYYLKETLNQLDNFLLSLKKANDFD